MESRRPRPGTLLGTRFLPDLENKAWVTSEDGSIEGIGSTAQLYIRRARLRVEILRQEGSAEFKYELFQRLNTGGTKLSEQEVRNCTAIMIDSSFHKWLVGLASEADFIETTQQTDTALRRQAGTELALRFIAFRHVRYEGGLDVHEYLDQALISLASDKAFDRVAEGSIFQRTFTLLRRAIGANSFKRWDGTEFTGKFLMSVFEVVARGVADNLPAIEALGAENAKAFLCDRVQSLWQNPTFLRNSGGGSAWNHSSTQSLEFRSNPLSPMKQIWTLTELQSVLDDEFSWRLKEIAELKGAVRRPQHLTEATVVRAGTALAYAHWEGFVKAASIAYVDYVNSTRTAHCDLVTPFAVLSLNSKLKIMTETKSAELSASAFEFIRDQMNQRANLFGRELISTDANLSSTVLKQILGAIGINIARYETRFNFIDETLLKNRHAIAHGDVLVLDKFGWITVADETIMLLRWIKTDIENAASTAAFRRPNPAQVM